MKKLTKGQTLIIGSMLFGLFFGAGNVIFPLEIGQLAGSSLIPASIGFFITATGLPLLAVNAQGVTQKDDLLDLSQSINPIFGWIFTLVLYLTIGPLYAIPRLATVSFEVGLAPWVPDQYTTVVLVIFSALFFGLVLYYSLKQSQIIDLIGKYLNPLFLFFVFALVLFVLTNPLGDISSLTALESYANFPLSTAFEAGYQTMDALAGLAFGILIVNAIKSYGLKDDKEISAAVLKAGLISTVFMIVVYFGFIYLGAMHRTMFPVVSNGGSLFANLVSYYFGPFGGVFLFVIITLATLKTGIGLVSAFAGMAEKLFPNKLSYNKWVVIVTFVAFLIANVGLETIIQLSVPVLNFIYPYAIMLILLANISKIFDNDSIVYLMAFLMIMFYQLFAQIMTILGNERLISSIIPFYANGLGWVVPAVVGAIIGAIIYKVNKN